MVPLPTIRTAVFGVCLVIPVVLGVYGVADRAKETEKDPHQRQNHLVAEWLNANTKPSDQVYAQCMSPGLYAQVHSYPPFPYLWTRHVDPIPERRAALARLLEGPDAPEYIAAFQSPSGCDSSGVMKKVINLRYRLVTTVDGVSIYERVPGK